MLKELGPDVVGFSVGEEVIGFTNRRASQELGLAQDAAQLTPRPKGVPWEVAGALFVAGATAYAAVRAVELKPGDTVAVSGATGGVGSSAIQLAALGGAWVIGIGGGAHTDWLQGDEEGSRRLASRTGSPARRDPGGLRVRAAPVAVHRARGQEGDRATP